VNVSLPRTPAERFAGILDLLHRALAAQGVRGRLVGPLLLAVCARLRRAVAHVTRLAAQVAAGTLPKPRAPYSRRPRAPRSPTPPDPAKPPIPAGFAWLLRLMDEAARHWVAGARAQLQHLLSDPDMVALIEAAPQMGRSLRPVCRMLGLRPPPPLARPRRPRARPDTVPPEPAPDDAAPTDPTAPPGTPPPKARRKPPAYWGPELKPIPGIYIPPPPHLRARWYVPRTRARPKPA
jgi:hypothetical protein